MITKNYAKYLLNPIFEDVYIGPVKDDITFQTSVCSELLEWYQSFHPNKPRYDQFDILDHLKKAPYIILIKVLSTGAYEYRIQGEAVFELVGKRNQGVIFSPESEFPHLKRLANYFDGIVSQNAAVHSFGKLTSHGKPYASAEALAVPLVDKNGHITHILSVMNLVN